MHPQAEDERFMALAYAEAVAAGLRHEVPVGAVLVGADGTVLARAGNRTIELSDPSAHAEVLALRAAGARQGNYRLVGATLFVTLEPCLMCMGAMIHARLARLVFGALDPKAGAAVSRYRIGCDQLLNHTLAIAHGPMALVCGELLTDFFRARRGGGKGRGDEGEGEAH
jgi:tRNA(adenine34) deaminase